MSDNDNGKEHEGSKEQKPRGKRPLTSLDPLHNDMYLSKNRQCSAMSKRTGERCGNRAMVAQRVCRMHGGATRQAKAKAARIVAEAQNEAAGLLVEFMADPDVAVDLRTKIAQDLLNRAGVSEKTILQIGVEQPKSFEDWVGEAIIDVEVADDPNVIDAEVIEDDTAPLVRREEVQTRHDRNAFAEVERAAHARARDRRPGLMTETERARIEAEALGQAPRRERPRRGGRSDDVQEMNAQQDAEDAELRRVKEAERRRNEERNQNRRARTSEATMSQPRRRGERS